MDSLNQVAGLVPLILFVISVSASAIIWIRGDVDRKTIQSLKDFNTQLEKDVKRHEKTIGEQNVRLEALETENADLREQRPSAEMIQLMYRALVEHDETSQRKLDHLIGSSS